MKDYTFSIPPTTNEQYDYMRPSKVQQGDL